MDFGYLPHVEAIIACRGPVPALPAPYLQHSLVISGVITRGLVHSAHLAMALNPRVS